MRNAVLTLYGGVGEVTGANFLLQTRPDPEEDRGENILIDCGLIQGVAAKEEMVNHEPFPYDPSSINALVVTHAHLDHIGRIPKLVREGFTGPIFSTPPTKDLAALMFEDALGLMQHEYEKKQAPPLYEKQDVEQALAQWRVQEYHTPFSLGDDVSARFLDAGHILGSAIVECTRDGRVFVATGDLGNSPAPLMRDTERVTGVHYLLMESVYGSRNHEEKEGRFDHFKAVVADTIQRKGVLLIPSFSIQRTQLLLHTLNTWAENNDIEPIDVYLDSPLAIKVTEVYKRYLEYLNENIQEQLKTDGDVFSFPGLSLALRQTDSRAIGRSSNPKIIIAGSGMSHGGRVRSHEKRYLSDKNATVLFVGYQVPGSLGRRIQDGARHVTIDGKRVRVSAHIETIRGFSAHKDRDGLIDFVESTADSLERVFVAMGEPSSALFLTQRLRDFLGVDAVAPGEGESFELDF